MQKCKNKSVQTLQNRKKTGSLTSFALYVTLNYCILKRNFVQIIVFSKLALIFAKHMIQEIKKIGLLALLLVLSSQVICAQVIIENRGGKTLINGLLYEYMIDECGDTIIMASLDDMSISSMRTFENPNDLSTYRRYRRYAYKVYPYATEAIKIFREVEYATNHMKNRKRRKYIRQLQKDLKEEFEDPLKKLTKTQGMVLFKMIEKELDTSMFDLLKDLKGGLSASYWGTLGRLYGHHLKDGYVRGEDEILDLVLDDMDVSYELPKSYRNRNKADGYE